MQQVSLHNLLTMTAPYKYKSEPWTKVCASEDWTEAALDLLGGKARIAGEFKYSTLGIHILSGIISKVSGITTSEFANRYLFAPLGIKPRKNHIAKNKGEHIGFVTSKTPKENLWFSDPQGLSAAGFGLCLSAQDLCKIGQLCLNNGLWNHNRVISAEWLSEMTTPYVMCNEKFHNMHYGFLWWIPDVDKKNYTAIGDSGNILYVNVEKNIAISITSTFKPSVLDRIAFINTYLLSFFEENLSEMY